MSKLTNCKACKAEIAKGVNKCPHCGKDQRGFFMKHKIITGLLVLVVIGIIGSAGNKPTKVGEISTAGKTSATPVVAETKAPVQTSFKVGDIIKLNEYKVTVNKVYVVPPSDLATPAEGNEFLAVDCTVENTSEKAQNISSLMMFKVVDKDGRSCDYSLMGIVAAKAGQLDGEIGVGRKITGVYVVETKKGTTGLELEFDGSLFSSGQIVVKLN